jgi:hypothetical protein
MAFVAALAALSQSGRLFLQEVETNSGTSYA